VLRDLHVRNLAVLAEVSVEFGPGLNVFTGETGAGKSIVVDSLALLAGARASSDLIRAGAELVAVTGVFAPDGDLWRRELEAAGVGVESDELVVRREISREGRNRVFINDQLVTLGLLAQIAPSLLRIHTQREELGLVSPDLQRSWLDTSGGQEAAELAERTAELYEAYAGLAARLERALGDDRLRQERIDLLRFQIGEIEAVRLRAGEEDELRRERELLRHAEAIRHALGISFGLLFEDEGAAVDRISGAARELEQIAEWESRAVGWGRGLQDLKIGLEEIASAIRQSLDEVESDPARLDTIEERLAVVERLTRKYGGSSAEVLAYRERGAAELEELQGDVEQQDELAARGEQALGAYRQVASQISRQRRVWGDRMVERVQTELQDLALKRARFAVQLDTRRSDSSPLLVAGEPVAFSDRGYDQVAFELAANPGEEMLPVAHSASGGELSRIYLALQLAVRGEGEAAATTLVFDEVDAGIGGAEAAALGRKLERLARGGQILAVTHLPQVASYADRHFRVHKRVAKGRTRTGVATLDHDQRVEEIARMLAGKKVTTTSLSHAQELIAGAGKPA
jgi:DNA repair protein RecN (Recombination protein N)